jgi:hypothetical protein
MLLIYLSYFTFLPLVIKKKVSMYIQKKNCKIVIHLFSHMQDFL